MTEIPTLPHFIRWSWRDIPTREHWAPKFAAIRRILPQLARCAVRDQLIPHIVQSLNSADVARTAAWCAEHELVLYPIDVDARRGEYLVLRVEQYTPAYIAAARICPTGGPPCCQLVNHHQSNSIDTTWERLLTTRQRPGLASMLWAPLGVSLLPFSPCSYDCAAATELAQQFVMLGRTCGHGDEMDDLITIHTWPVVWTRLFGIVEATSPHIKWVTRSTWTPTLDTYTVGDARPQPVVFHHPKYGRTV